MAAWSKKATSVKMAAIHIKANIFTPMLARMLSWSWAVRATLAAMLMTVAMMAATETKMEAMAARRVRSRLNQRVRMTRRLAKMRTKLTLMPPMKKAYMILEPILRRLRTVTAWEGRAIWAPARSSLIM